MSDVTSKPDPLTGPWDSLYGPGTGLESCERANPRFEPLLKGIERAIVSWCDETGRTASGGSLGVTIKQVAMNHESPSADPVVQAVQKGVRVCLANNDYSRRDVKGALRTVAKSIEFHTREAGPAGYVSFVRPFLKGGA